jgi:hypothetical protein
MFLVLGSAVGFAADVVCDFVAGAARVCCWLWRSEKK